MSLFDGPCHAPARGGEGANAPPPHRTCLPCAACCVRLPIPAGAVGPEAKPAGVRCPRLGPAGCAAYAVRPGLCADFRCAWLADASWPEAWRPDCSGLLCLRERVGGSLPAAAVYELYPGALLRREGARIVEELRKSTAVLVTIDVRARRRRLVGRLLEHGEQRDPQQGPERAMPRAA